MRLSKAWLEEKGACSGGLTWFLNQKETDLAKVVGKLIKEKQFKQKGR